MGPTDTEKLKTLLTILTAAGVSEFYHCPNSGEVTLKFHPPQQFKVIGTPSPVTGTVSQIPGMTTTTLGEQYHELFGGTVPTFNAPKKAG